MMEETDRFDVLPEGWTPANSIIKVIGVGGGGCNAVAYMYKEKVQGCSFIVCNTDSQALEKSCVPVRIQLGKGRGAGCDPVKGRNAALEAQDEIAKVALDSGTEMLFITAGMGGGTGTGASPVIAKMAKDRGILTVAVVTLPFENEGNDSLTRAIDGISELEKNVDSLLIINNQKLYTYFGDELVQNAFPKADEVLATAVRGITEIISRPGYINIDFQDIKTLLKDSGMALMGCGTGTGQNRIDDAVNGAFDSPLLNDFDLTSAKNVLVNITVGRNERGVTMTQLEEVNRKIAEHTGNANNFKRGLVYDDNESVGDRIHITAIATGLKFIDAIGMKEGELGNFIMIDDNFVYRKGVTGAEDGISLGETPSHTTKIGFSSKDNCRHFHYTEDEKPVLLVSMADDRSALKRSAISRKNIKKA